MLVAAVSRSGRAGVGLGLWWQERWIGPSEEPGRATGPALRRGRHLDHTDLRDSVADTKTRRSAGFDPAAAGVRFGADHNRRPTSQCLLTMRLSGGERPIPCHNRSQALAVAHCPHAAVACEADAFPATCLRGQTRGRAGCLLTTSEQTVAAAAAASSRSQAWPDPSLYDQILAPLCLCS